ncbi:MAG TPA: glycosyltransferase family 2 protein [Burkholderiales bacterium]|nr:glycosyltransferase family 2 protein [Burkholderiales bacterium]
MTALVTIAIPTWNRARYLAQNLAQLRSEMAALDSSLVEVLVSDNCSPDDTPLVVESAIRDGLPVRYVRNETNLGWAVNFAQCFELAQGRYVLLLGDDDLFVDGALAMLVARLQEQEYGVVCIRPYGYDEDFRQEHPGGGGRERAFSDTNAFLLAISRYFTLTSACVINKALVQSVDSRQFLKSDLAVFHLILRAALAADHNLYIEKYLLASKRQNSFSYEYTEVFVNQFWAILDAHVPHGLTARTIRKLERDKLLSYYPFYLLDLRMWGRGSPDVALRNFERRFKGRLLFTVWLLPIIRWPKPLAVLWGSATTVVGRILAGDLRRGFAFALNKATRLVIPRRGRGEQGAGSA